MECRKEQNLKRCNCTYEPCPKKGMCCECLQLSFKKWDNCLLVVSLLNMKKLMIEVLNYLLN